VGGHLTALRRLRVGRFDLAGAHTLEQLGELSEAAEREGERGIPLVPVAEAARAALPVHEVTAQEATLLGHGRRIASGPDRAAAVAALDPSGRLVAVLDESAAQARAKVVFAPAGAGD
ncbi:MAG: tRNA pseudouridine synthase, partial [Humibacillus sp.]|nr:tRNA pseudouridine synthase [Humibacillus sp.]